MMDGILYLVLYTCTMEFWNDPGPVTTTNEIVSRLPPVMDAPRTPAGKVISFGTVYINELAANQQAYNTKDIRYVLLKDYRAFKIDITKGTVEPYHIEQEAQP